MREHRIALPLPSHIPYAGYPPSQGRRLLGLGSSPSFPRSRESSRLAYVSIDIPPHGILLFYQSQFPCPSPFLNLLFPSDCVFRASMCFIIDERLDIVFPRKPSDRPVLVLPHSLYQIRSNTCVKGAISLGCQYVNVELLCHCHPTFHTLDPRLRGDDGCANPPLF